MTQSGSARRQGLRKTELSVALFPFLAVLICTMGALIVLLVVLVQQARVHADQVAESRREQAVQASLQLEEQRIEQENYEWRLDVLQTQKEEISRKLADERLRLSHVEDHYRRLKADLQAMLDQAADLERVIAGGAEHAVAAQSELARLHQSIELARRELEDARQQGEQEPQTFAIIPYEGPQGTRRRPIYIECLRDRIVIQPEGIAFAESDFEGPLGPGNPLDAALRAAREYLARAGAVHQHGEPYPLMVVRSQGARAYAAARAAIESWDEEFGYELIDDDLTLTYPPSDPALRETMHAAVEEARRRQQIVRAAQPNRFKERAIGGFQATSRHGGFRAVGDHENAYSQGGFGGGSDQGGMGGAGSGDDPLAMGEAPDTGGGPESSFADRRDRAGGGGSGSFDASGASGGVAGGTNASGSTTGSPGGTGAGPGGSEEGGAMTSLTVSSSFAAKRGHNWGLKDAAEGATPYTRPIAVQCFPDRLVLVPERGSGQEPVEIPMAGATREAVDPFVQALWKRMDRWGLAGNRAYWKPVLKFEVAPGAESRYQEIERLLDRSGLEIERKSP